MKWRRIAPSPPPEVLIDENIGPHHVIVIRASFEGEPMFRALQLLGPTRSTIGVSADSPEAALLQAARCLGYEPAPDDETPP